MPDKEFDEMLEEYAHINDFGRVVFPDKERLLDFVYRIQEITRKNILETL
jgi:hypothetical protein